MTDIEVTQNYRLRIERDEDAVNPRLDRDGICTSYFVLPSYDWRKMEPGQTWEGGVVNNHNSLSEAIRYFFGATDRHAHWHNGRALRPFDATTAFARWGRIFHGWDLGVVVSDGILWYSDPELCERWGATMGVETTRGEVEEYELWADGEVYGYVLEEATVVTTTTVRKSDGKPVSHGMYEDWRVIESVWGFYGQDEAEREGREALDRELA